MSERYAVRTIRLCTKDCLCLYVCPTGATDTENSVIDIEKCIGCGVCADACPSGAISMVPKSYPPQQKHTEEVVAAMRSLLRSKSAQEGIADGLTGKLAAAVEKSNRIMAEDIIRESGYMLPQSGNTRAFLEKIMAEQTGEGFPRAAAEKLLTMLETNEAGKEEKMEEKTETWKCLLCGYTHHGSLPEGFTCPRCGQPAEVFEKQD